MKQTLKPGRDKLLEGATQDNNSLRLTDGLPTAEYDLVSVVTHQGRSMQSGHYVCWNKVNTKNWVKLDDNHAEPAVIDQILDLEGGGD